MFITFFLCSAIGIHDLGVYPLYGEVAEEIIGQAYSEHLTGHPRKQIL